jgi:uncharacterized SAM-binding protein YcdF (DUF218 family)
LRLLKSCALYLVAGLLVWTLLAWIAAAALVTNAELERADAIVVFSGSAAYRERAHRAAELFRAGRSSLIILTNDNLQSGWSQKEERNPLFVERARDELLASGVPAESIVVLPQTVTSTYEEAQLVRDYARANGLHSILFVTSAYHSRRALWTVRRAFAESNVAVGLDAVPVGLETPRPLTWWLHAKGWTMVAEEYPKLLYYRLWYG